MFHSELKAPSIPSSWHSGQQLCLELPFPYKFENLSYIGVDSRETWNICAHSHNHFELYYIDEGKGWFSVGDFWYEVREGDLFLIKPNEVHCGAAAGKAPFRVYYFGFQFEHMRELEVEYYQLSIHRVTNDQQKTVKQICDCIIEEIKNNQPYTRSMVRGLFLQMLVHVARAYRNNLQMLPPGSSSLSSTIEEVLSYLHENVHVRHNIQHLADLFRISRTHLEREFKRCIGTTLGQYIRLLCIDRAKFYLRETPDSITKISEKLEFDSIHKFSMFFKRNVGMPPMKYREMTKKLK